jgi:hypothetical protein
MPPDAAAFLAVWHRIVSTKDLDGLACVLRDDVAIGAPPYWQKLEGRPLVHRLLGVILDTIEDFTYHREWTSGRELALEFHGRVGGRRLQGIDLITLDDENRIVNLDVLIRPMNALEELRDRVAPRMAAAS